MGFEICIIDDEAGINDLCKDFLKSQGENIVTTFTSPKSALDAILVNNYLPDAIMVDLKMPEMSGLQFLQTLRDSNKNFPTVIMSGYLEKDNTLDAISMGVNTFLEKPFDFDKLNALLQKCINQFLQVKNQEIIIDEYEHSFKTCAELKDIYMQKSIKAENKLMELGVEFIEHKTGKEFIEQMKLERQLEKDLASREEVLRKLKNIMLNSFNG